MRFDEATAIHNTSSGAPAQQPVQQPVQQAAPESAQRSTPDPATAASPTRYIAEIASGWSINGNANGGYLLALAGRAMVRHTGRPDPVSITAHYVSPGKDGPIAIDVQTLKNGRRFGVARATIISQNGDGKPIIEVLGTFGDLSQAQGPELVDATPPDLPPVQECVGLQLKADDGFAPEIFSSLDVRLHPEDANFNQEPSGNALVRGWMRLNNDEPIDSIALLLATDAFPPTAFNAKLPVSWVPTIELTAHIRANPAPGWLRCEFRTHFVTGGFLEEDGRIWDSAGTLVAQSRQLALTPLG